MPQYPDNMAQFWNYELNNEPGHSCIDGVFTQVVEKTTTRYLSTNPVFVDLLKAYDTEPLNKLWTNTKTGSVLKKI